MFSFNVPMTNHHPNCPNVDESLIDVWTIKKDGRSLVVAKDPSIEPPYDAEETDGATITKSKMHAEIYENLPEFDGF